ncbi:CBF/Mak21 family protein [Trichuris suis]|nr:CBF/Mak21 family protein [Trichuris suis]
MMANNFVEQLPLIVVSVDEGATKEFFDALDKFIVESAASGPIASYMDIFSEMINAAVENEKAPTDVFLSAFREQCAYWDVCSAALSSALNVGNSNVLCDERKMRNYFLMLQCMSPNCGSPTLLVPQASSRFKSSRLKKLFTESWLQFIRLPMEMSLRCDCLVWLSENVLRNVSTPMLFADFVTDCFQMEHPLNALALGSIVILILQCNMFAGGPFRATCSDRLHFRNYPKLYDEVYNMLHPDIFTMPHRTVFLQNLDMIMRSTHLPVYLIAAFIKRLSRLLLLAPVDCCLTFLGLIRNWLIRHPSCQFLVNRSSKALTVDTDPYDFKATDPANCNSMTTSLWEIQTMKHHYSDKVVRTAGFIDCPLPSVELPFRLESNADRIFREVLRAAPKEYLVAEEKSAGLFQLPGVVGELFAP